MHYQRWFTSGDAGEAELRRTPGDPTRTEKRCTTCGEVKPMAEFYADGRSRDKRQSSCKTCFGPYQRNIRLKRKYGLTAKEYDAMLAGQDGRCAICGSSERLVLDHDHVSGATRQFLCDPCNVVLGRVKDDPQRLRAAADYIERHRGG